MTGKCSWFARRPRRIDKPCDATMHFPDELCRANVCRRFRDSLGTARPNWPTAQPLETAPCCYLLRREESILPPDRSLVLCPSEQPLATARVFVGQCPRGVLRAMQSRVPQNAIDPVNAEAESDDVDGSFLPGQVLIAEFLHGDGPKRGK